MSAADDILNSLPIDQIAASVGSDPDSVREAASVAVPALLHGLDANASAGGADALVSALGQHSGDLADSPSYDAIDQADGEKITQHVFGGDTDSVINQLGGVGGAGGSSLIKKLLPIIAPIVMSYLAKQLASKGSAGGAGGSGDGGGIANQILQEILKGAISGSGGGSSSNIGDVLGNVLGGLLGKGSK